MGPKGVGREGTKGEEGKRAREKEQILSLKPEKKWRTTGRNIPYLPLVTAYSHVGSHIPQSHVHTYDYTTHSQK